MPEARDAVPADTSPRTTRVSAGYTGLGWLIAALSIAWAALIHHGVGPPPTAEARQWFEPNGFLHEFGPLAFAFESLPLALVLLAAPSFVAIVAIWFSCRAATARTLSIVAMFATLLFVFYGGFAPFPWRFFGGLGSASLSLTAFWVGLAVAAPLLAAAWRRVGPAKGFALYLPIAIAAIVFVRNATGTDPALRFAISPWPAVAIFGIEVAGGFFASTWLGVAIALAGLRTRADGAAGSRLLRGSTFALCGFAAACAGVAVTAAAGLFPFAVGPTTFLAAASVVAAAALLAAATSAADAPTAMGRRARAFGVAAALIAIPLVVGELLVQFDYDRTRNRRAQRIIAALENYYARESLYPESLDALVSAGFLPEIPEPAIGFRLLASDRFSYHDFGTSYLLEFSAPRWVECAYSPPYADEDDEEDDTDYAESAPEDSELGGSWSCPAEPPELW